jgi:hypothetical protein
VGIGTSDLSRERSVGFWLRIATSKNARKTESRGRFAERCGRQFSPCGYPLPTAGLAAALDAGEHQRKSLGEIRAEIDKQLSSQNYRNLRKASLDSKSTRTCVRRVPRQLLDKVTVI